MKKPLDKINLKATLKKNNIILKDFAEFCGYSANGFSNYLVNLKGEDIKPVLKYALLLFLLERVKKIDPELLVSDLLVFKDETELSADDKITTKESS